MSAEELRSLAKGMEARSLTGMAAGARVIADSLEILEAENAALKEQNERLEREVINTLQMFTSSDARLAAQITENAVLKEENERLKARVAELEHALKTLVEHNS